MLMDNTSASGSIDVDKFQRAMLIYRNAIDPETKVSPAMILFGRPIRDHIPIPMGRYCPHETWRETRDYREMALAKRHSREHEKWTEHTHSLPQLKVGDNVFLQNLTGNHPRRWERTGIVVEVRQFHQYAVKIDGSGRITLRNRQHLRKFTPFQSRSPLEVVRSPNEPPQAPRDNPTVPNEVCPEAPGSSQVPETTVPINPIAQPHQDTAISSAMAAPPAESEESHPGPSPCVPDAPPVKVPQALKRLRSHNAPGLSEDPENVLHRRTRNRIAQNR